MSKNEGLEDAVARAHGALDVQGLDVLPVLLQQGDEEVDRDLHVGVDLLRGHADMGTSDAKGEHLLQLELDGGLDVVDLLLEVLSALHECGELTHLVHGGSKETGDLLHNGPRSQEEGVLVRELLDLLLVLVEGLEGLDVEAVQPSRLGLLHVEGIPKHAARHALARDVGQLDGAGETLVLLRVVVLEHDLEFDGLHELALPFLAVGDDLFDGLAKEFGVDFAHCLSSIPVGGRY